MGSGSNTLDDYKKRATKFGINSYDEITPMTLLDDALLIFHQEAVSQLVENGAKKYNQIIFDSLESNNSLCSDLNNLIVEFL